MYRASIDLILTNIKAVLTFIQKAEFVDNIRDHLTEFKGNYLLAYLSENSTPLRFDALDLMCAPNYRTTTDISLVFIYDKTFDSDKVLENFLNNIGTELISAEPRTNQVYFDLYDELIPSSDYKLLKIDIRLNDVFSKQNCVIDVC